MQVFSRVLLLIQFFQILLMNVQSFKAITMPLKPVITAPLDIHFTFYSTFSRAINEIILPNQSTSLPQFLGQHGCNKVCLYSCINKTYVLSALCYSTIVYFNYLEVDFFPMFLFFIAFLLTWESKGDSVRAIKRSSIANDSAFQTAPMV